MRAPQPPLGLKRQWRLSFDVRPAPKDEGLLDKVIDLVEELWP